MRTPWNLQVGLVLGGGAARGMAHVGVIKALQQAGIQIHLVAGTSVGSIIGGAWAATMDIDGLENKLRAILTSEEFRHNRLSFLKESREQRGGLLYSVGNLIRRGIVYGVSTLQQSFVSAEEFAATLGGMVPDVRIEDCMIPFGAVALDLESGDVVVLCHGSLRKAVAASSAIPGLLPPVRKDGRVLIDGGWADKVPVLPAFRMGADVVLAVDISADLDDTRDYRKGSDIMVRANAIKDAVLTGFSRDLADLVIEPEVKDIHWADFDSFEECIEAGRIAAEQAIPAIRELLRQARWRTVLHPRLGKRLAERYLDGDSMHLTLD